MNIALLIFNIVFYSIILFLYGETQRDPGSSLGIGFMLLFLFILSPIIQFILWRLKVIKVKTVLDKIGMITATPLIPIIVFGVLSAISAGTTR